MLKKTLITTLIMQPPDCFLLLAKFFRKRKKTKDSRNVNQKLANTWIVCHKMIRISELRKLKRDPHIVAFYLSKQSKRGSSFRETCELG